VKRFVLLKGSGAECRERVMDDTATWEVLLERVLSRFAAAVRDSSQQRFFIFLFCCEFFFSFVRSSTFGCHPQGVHLEWTDNASAAKYSVDNSVCLDVLAQ